MEILKPYRDRIDALDDRIVDLLAERLDIIAEVGHLKAREGIPAILPDRVAQVIDRAADRAKIRNIDPALVCQLYTILVDYSCNLEEEIRKEKAA